MRIDWKWALIGAAVGLVVLPKVLTKFAPGLKSKLPG